MFTKSLFLLNYKPSSQRVPRVGRVWLAQAHTQALKSPSTTRNVMRPKRPSWTSPLTKANRPHLFTAYNVYPDLRHAGLYLLAFPNITRSCGVNSCAPCTHPQTNLRAINTAPTPPNPLHPPTSPQKYGFVEN
jgi:hypothetical protein